MNARIARPWFVNLQHVHVEAARYVRSRRGVEADGVELPVRYEYRRAREAAALESQMAGLLVFRGAARVAPAVLAVHCLKAPRLLGPGPPYGDSEVEGYPVRRLRHVWILSSERSYADACPPEARLSAARQSTSVPRRRPGRARATTRCHMPGKFSEELADGPARDDRGTLGAAPPSGARDVRHKEHDRDPERCRGCVGGLARELVNRTVPPDLSLGSGGLLSGVVPAHRAVLQLDQR